MTNRNQYIEPEQLIEHLIAMINTNGIQKFVATLEDDDGKVYSFRTGCNTLEAIAIHKITSDRYSSNLVKGEPT